MRLAGLILLWPILAMTAAAQAPPSSPEAPTIPTLPDVHPELLRLVVEDQWDRGMDMFGGRQVKAPDAIDWGVVATRDEERRSGVRSLLAKGAIQSGREFHFGAIVFQHSDAATDVRLAHLLAMTAVAKGHDHARWLAAATLDRHLWHLEQPQIFGTQFKQAENGAWTMEPYDREAIPDSLRAQWCVVPVVAQVDVLAQMQRGGPPGSTSIADCK